MKKLDVLAAALLVVGGLNWGLVALARFDLVAFISGAGSYGNVNAIGVLIYGLVGAAALYQAMGWKAIQRRWAHIATSATALALVLGLVATAFAYDKPAAAEHTKDMKEEVAAKDIVDVAMGAGSFTTLITAVKAAGLVETLKGKGPFTVFAPTDEAFAKLPEGTLEGLLKEKDRLIGVLTYHVVPGRLMAEDVVKLKEVATVQGQKVDFTVGKGEVKVGEAKIIATDVKASNGVIHVIDTVILPR